MRNRVCRRRFLSAAACGAAGLTILPRASSAWAYAANERPTLGLIGVGGRGTWFVGTMPRMADVVALCDVDDRKMVEALQRWEEGVKRFASSPNAWERRAADEYARLLKSRPRTFRDFRPMLDKMGDGLDAVVIATPDHTHAVASAAAMRAGKHVMCEKPLTRTVDASRALRELARRQKVATSMGNQGTAAGPFRRALELIRDGAIGEVREVHIWNSGGGADRKTPPEGEPPVPEALDWDLWLGPAAQRPYHPDWMKRNLWRDFGTCQLGNWASHTANLAFMALRVHELWSGGANGDNPVLRVEARTSGINRLSFPRWEIVKWRIPARANLGPITFTWYNGGAPGRRDLVEALEKVAAEKDRRGIDFAGALIVGEKGRVHTTGHNATFRLLPEGQFQDVQRQRPEHVEASRGHEMDWIEACRGGKPPWARFEYASALNEFLMLGNVATQVEGDLEFDPAATKITNNAQADGLLRSDYREPWRL